MYIITIEMKIKKLQQLKKQKKFQNLIQNHI
jgi:hypothetical protein